MAWGDPWVTITFRRIFVLNTGGGDIGKRQSRAIGTGRPKRTPPAPAPWARLEPAIRTRVPIAGLLPLLPVVVVFTVRCVVIQPDRVVGQQVPGQGVPLGLQPEVAPRRGVDPPERGGNQKKYHIAGGGSGKCFI